MPTRLLRWRASASSSSFAKSSPSTRTIPPVGRSRPATTLRSVDLPEPDGPITATNSPGRIPSVTPASAATVAWPDAYVRSRPSASTARGAFTVVKSARRVRPSARAGDQARDAEAHSERRRDLLRRRRLVYRGGRGAQYRSSAVGDPFQIRRAQPLAHTYDRSDPHVHRGRRAHCDRRGAARPHSRRDRADPERDASLARGEAGKEHDALVHPRARGDADRGLAPAADEDRGDGHGEEPGGQCDEVRKGRGAA